jgi:hypothetical protein
VTGVPRPLVLRAGTHELTLFVNFGPMGHFVYDNGGTITVQLAKPSPPSESPALRLPEVG